MSGELGKYQCCRLHLTTSCWVAYRLKFGDAIQFESAKPSKPSKIQSDPNLPVRPYSPNLGGDPLNLGGTRSEIPFFGVFFEVCLLSLGGESVTPKFRGMGLQGWVTCNFRHTGTNFQKNAPRIWFLIHWLPTTSGSRSENCFNHSFSHGPEWNSERRSENVPIFRELLQEWPFHSESFFVQNLGGSPLPVAAGCSVAHQTKAIFARDFHHTLEIPGWRWHPHLQSSVFRRDRTCPDDCFSASLFLRIRFHLFWSAILKLRYQPRRSEGLSLMLQSSKILREVA